MKSIIAIVCCLIFAIVFLYQAQKHRKIVASYVSSPCRVMKFNVDYGPTKYSKGGSYHWVDAYWTVVLNHTMTAKSPELTIYEAETQRGEHNPNVRNDRHQKYKVTTVEKIA